MKDPKLPSPPAESPFPDGAAALAFADGASRGNPGAAAYGCVYALEDGTPLCAEGEAIGQTTNNVAEWKGCIAALRRLRQWGVTHAVVKLDSQLVVRQISGQYKVKQPHLQPLHAEATALTKEFARVSVQHVPRAENALADAVANAALDR